MKMITSFEAGQIFGCSPAMARKIIGEPDQIHVMDNKKIRFYYEETRVLNAFEEHKERMEARRQGIGLRTCRSCGKKFQQKELSTGKCPLCRAEYICYNFICHGDSFEHAPDPARIEIIQQALDRNVARLKEKNA